MYLNWKMFVARHWKVTLLLVQLGLFVLTVIVLSDAIDSPIGP